MMVDVVCCALSKQEHDECLLFKLETYVLSKQYVAGFMTNQQAGERV